MNEKGIDTMSTDTDSAIYARGDVYHDFYLGRGKNYAAEAALVAGIVAEATPQAASLLDVACGTGSHLLEFARHFDSTVGVDLSAEMLAVARQTVPGVALHQADMIDMALGTEFDVVTCMFSSIGYLHSVTDLDRALRNLADHTRPGGVVVVEPWWFPDNFIPGWVGSDIVKRNDRTIVRVSHTELGDGMSHMTVHFTVASADTGIEHFVDTHAMTLFDRETYTAAFTRAGLDVAYRRDPLFGPGVFVGTKS